MSASQLPHLTVTVLGVDFRWQNPGRAWREPVSRGLDAIHRAIIAHASPAIRRQKRGALFYGDAVSGILKGELAPTGKEGVRAWELAVELAIAIADQRIKDELVLELGNFEPIAGVRSRIGYFTRQDALERQGANPRVADHLIYDIYGRAKPQSPGLYRHFELDRGGLEEEPESIDWFHVLSLAVLVQLRADFELYIDTDVFPLRCCERLVCRSFFRVKLMAALKRYCSDICRASAAREQ